MRAICILLFAVWCLPVNAGEFRHYSQWSKQEQTWFTAYALASYVDYQQTRWALDQTNAQGQPVYSEANPMLGKHPSEDRMLMTKLAVLGFQYWSMGSMGFENTQFRHTFKALTVFQFAVVAHNDYMGVSISHSF